jgi:hypothetical protein
VPEIPSVEVVLSRYWWWLALTGLVIVILLLNRHRIRGWLAQVPAKGAVLLLAAAVIAVAGMFASPTGDEPHYLVMTQSMLRDGDFDLRNNYEQRNFSEYYAGELGAHVIEIGEHWYPVHGIGLPMLAVPWYAIGGRPGVVLMLALFSVAGIRLTWLTLERAGIDAASAGVAAVVAGFTLPLASLSSQIFPEVPAFLLVALALYTLVVAPVRKRHVVAFSIAVALLPWLHPKFALLSVALLAGAVLIHRRQMLDARIVVGGLAFLVTVAAMVTLFNAWYGAPLPPNIMPRVPGDENWLVTIAGHFFRRPSVGLTGALFDQQYGLLIASPVFLLVVPGVVLLWRRSRALAATAVLMFLAIYLPAGVWGDWHGGFSSPARFFVPAVPSLALGLAAILETRDRVLHGLFTVLAFASFAYAYVMVTLPYWIRYGEEGTGRNYFVAFLDRLSGLDLTPIVPSLKIVTETTWLTVIAYVVAVTLFTAFALRRAGSSISASGA